MGEKKLTEEQTALKKAFEGSLCNYLENQGSAFTIEALEKRVDSFIEDPNEREYGRENLEQILNKLRAHGQINSSQHNGVTHYFVPKQPPKSTNQSSSSLKEPSKIIEKMRRPAKREIITRISNLRCFKCESKEELKTYTFKIGTKTSYKTKTFGPNVMTTTYDVHHLPVCNKCLPDLKKWSEKNSKNFRIHFLLSLVWLIAICLQLYFILVHSDPLSINDFTIYIIMGIMLLVSYIVIRIILRRQEFNPFKYAKFKSGGRCFIKTANSDEWISYEEWKFG